MPHRTDADGTPSRAPRPALVALCLVLGVLGVLGGLSLALDGYVNPVLPLLVAAIGGACLLASAFGVGTAPSSRWVLLAVVAAVLGAWAICAYAPPAVVVFGESWTAPLYEGLPQPLTGVWSQVGLAPPDCAAPATSDLLYPCPRDYYTYPCDCYPYPYWYGQVVLPFWPLVSAAASAVAVWLGWRAWPRAE